MAPSRGSRTRAPPPTKAFDQRRIRLATRARAPPIGFAHGVDVALLSVRAVLPPLARTIAETFRSCVRKMEPARRCSGGGRHGNFEKEKQLIKPSTVPATAVFVVACYKRKP